MSANPGTTFCSLSPWTLHPAVPAGSAGCWLYPEEVGELTVEQGMCADCMEEYALWLLREKA